MRGRKPKPTRLKVLEGNPGLRPLNDSEPEPEILTRAPHCPKRFGANSEAAKEWRRVTKTLVDTGIITELDTKLLEIYCDAYETYLAAADSIREKGVVLQTDSKWITNPACRVADAATKQIRAIMAELGMTPSSRSRIKVPKSGGNADPMEEVLSS